MLVDYSTRTRAQFWCMLTEVHFTGVEEEVTKLRSSLQNTAIDLQRTTSELENAQSQLLIKESEVEALRRGKS